VGSQILVVQDIIVTKKNRVSAASVAKNKKQKSKK
jgi:hypothetical protein